MQTYFRMPASQQVAFWMSLVTSLGAGLVAGTLFRRGLMGSYRAFFWYLCAECVIGLAWLIIRWTGSNYFIGLAYLISQPVLWLFYIAVVLEIYRKCLHRFRGIARVGQQILLFGLIGSMILSVATIQPDLEVSRHLSAVKVLYVTAGHRVITGGITLFLLMLAVVLNWFPVPIAPNTFLHTAVSFFFFLSMTIAHSYRNLIGTDATDNMNAVVMVMGTCCLIAWGVRLVPEGESDGAIPAGDWKDGGWLLEQMEAINRALLRVVK